MTDQLSPKQARFVDEYLKDLNAAAAVRRAGYSDKRPDAIGYELLRKPEIQDAIQAAQKARSHRTGLTQDAVLRELAIIGFSDLSKFVDWGPDGVTLKDSSTIDPELRRAIIYITQTQHGISIRLADKNAALEKLARHLGLYDEQTDKTTRIIVEHVDEGLGD